MIYFFAESRLLSKQIAQFAGKAQFVVTYTAERKKNEEWPKIILSLAQQIFAIIFYGQGRVNCKKCSQQIGARNRQVTPKLDRQKANATTNKNFKISQYI